MSNNRAGKFALGALLAAAVGYAAGLLTAPKSGKETRQDIKSGISRARAAAERKLKHAHSDLSDLIEKGRKASKDATGSAKKELEKTLNTAQKARDKARDVLSAVHEGEAEDKNLNRSIQETKKAIEHLKRFLAADKR